MLVWIACLRVILPIYVNPGSIADKSASDKERESWMIDQWVCLTEERNAVLVPLQGSGIPGAPPLEG